jgi:cell division septation protein DedD
VSPPQTYGFLKGVSANVQNASYSLTASEVLIGRGTACQIQLKDPKVSRKHARIRYDQGVVRIEDLNSAHGTLVNGVRVTAVQLSGGEELTLGDTRFRFDRIVLAAPAAQPVVPLPVSPTPIAQAPQPTMAAFTPETAKRRQWLPFIVGLGIPLFLGAIGIVALIALGVFNEPEGIPAPIPSQSEALEPTTDVEPTAKPDEIVIPAPTVEGEGDVPLETPPYIVRAYDPSMDAGLPTQNDLANYDDQNSDSEFLYVIPLETGQQVILDNFYCGKSEELLNQIEPFTVISFEIDGNLVLEEDLYTDRVIRDTRACNGIRGVFTGMKPGEYSLTETMNVTQQIYDGWETWGPEELVDQILIRVEGEEIGGIDSTEPSPGASEPSELTITLYVGDARSFTNPPTVIAYANTQARPAPPEIAINEGCADDCIRYYEWMGIPKANQWIEGSSTFPTTAIGVQLWSDTTGGFARVYLDGEEVWSGDTRGEDNQWPGGAFVRYLEISGLPDTTHSLRVESLGEGGPVTLYFFGIGPVVP